MVRLVKTVQFSKINSWTVTDDDMGQCRMIPNRGRHAADNGFVGRVAASPQFATECRLTRLAVLLSTISKRRLAIDCPAEIKRAADSR